MGALKDKERASGARSPGRSARSRTRARCRCSSGARRHGRRGAQADRVGARRDRGRGRGRAAGRRAPGHERRRARAGGLGARRDRRPERGRSLAGALKDSSAEVRKQAAWALGELEMTGVTMPENDELSQKLSRRERQIMDFLYQHGRATAAEVQANLPDPPSYSAVRAMLRMLEEKGHAHTSRTARATSTGRAWGASAPAFGAATPGAHLLRRLARAGRGGAPGRQHLPALRRRARSAVPAHRPGATGRSLTMSPHDTLITDVLLKATLGLGLAALVAPRSARLRRHAPPGLDARRRDGAPAPRPARDRAALGAAVAAAPLRPSHASSRAPPAPTLPSGDGTRTTPRRSATRTRSAVAPSPFRRSRSRLRSRSRPARSSASSGSRASCSSACPC